MKPEDIRRRVKGVGPMDAYPGEPVMELDLEELMNKGVKRAIAEEEARRARGEPAFDMRKAAVAKCQEMKKKAGCRNCNYFPDQRTETREIDLPSCPAHEVCQLLRKGDVNAGQLVECCHVRRHLADGLVNATPRFWYDRALRDAKLLELGVQETEPGYLLGLPVLAKGTMKIKGLPVFDGYYDEETADVATETSAIVNHVQTLGGTIVGMTNVPEFAAGSQTFNEVHGATATPYDIRRTAGGSSGGSAAALASRQCWLALGSDLGGSLRTPAAFCGVVGLRPTPGRIMRDHDARTRRYDLHAVDGPMARTVLDLSLFMDCLTTPVWGSGLAEGWDGLYDDAPAEDVVGDGGPLPCPNTTWFALAWHGYTHRVGCKRVAVSSLGAPVNPDIMRLMHEVADRLSQTPDPPEVDEPWPLDVAETVFYALRVKMFAEQYADHPELASLKPEIQWNAKAADGVDAEAAWRLNRDVIAPAVLSFFDSYELLITPCTIDLPFHKNVRYPASPAYGSGKHEFRDYMHWLKPCYVVSVTECPALVMPCGSLGPDDLPVGVQLVARPGEDALLTVVAASLEAQLDLDFRDGIETPRSGSEPLDQSIGPTNAQQAKAHHDRRAPVTPRLHPASS